MNGGQSDEFRRLGAVTRRFRPPPAGRIVRLRPPKPASLRSTTTGNLGNVGLYRDALYLTEFDDPPLPLPETGARW